VYQNKVNSSLTIIQRPGHWADNCKMVYSHLGHKSNEEKLSSVRNFQYLTFTIMIIYRILETVILDMEFLFYIINHDA